MKIHKYPRTHHLQGSRQQPGDEDLDLTPWSELAGRHAVVEEKLDGANVAFRFSASGEVVLQSRGHFLEGGYRERHFDWFKSWAQRWSSEFFNRLGERYVVYGEWLYAKHTIFYDRLPHYFLEFDILDLESESFLSTPRRQALLRGLPIVSVPVLAEGKAEDLGPLPALVGPSLFVSESWKDALRRSGASSLASDGQPDRS